MNYNSLIYFKTVAELQHFTKAAEALFISQPALSKAIHNLEKELQTPLFKKSGRNVVLTQAGEIFYKYIKLSIENVENGISAVENYKNSIKNTIKISAINSMYANFLPEKIIDFKSTHPAIKFNLEFKGTSFILNDIKSNISDFGICSDFDLSGEYANFERVLLKIEPIAIITSKNHKLSLKKSVSINELQNEKFIVYKKTKFGTNKILNSMCADYNFTPNITTEAYNDHALCALVSMGEGISLISKHSGISLDQVAVLDIIHNPVPKRRIYMIWNKDKILSNACLEFINLMKSNT